MIRIEPLPDELWLVTVIADTTTEHRVHVSAADIRRLGRGAIGARELLEASFLFLLDHESNISILPSFDLSVISRYFPEYEKEISRYLDQ